MINSIKARTPILVLILFVFAVGYTVAEKVVVIPMNSDTPSGMVSAFNSETCPAGWTKYTPAQGRFVVGLNDGGRLGSSTGKALTDGEIMLHNHQWSRFNTDANKWITYQEGGAGDIIMPNTISGSGSAFHSLANFDSSQNTSYYTRVKSDTPPYVQLLYCEKV